MGSGARLGAPVGVQGRNPGGGLWGRAPRSIFFHNPARNTAIWYYCQNNEQHLGYSQVKKIQRYLYKIGQMEIRTRVNCLIGWVIQTNILRNEQLPRWAFYIHIQIKRIIYMYRILRVAKGWKLWKVSGILKEWKFLETLGIFSFGLLEAILIQYSNKLKRLSAIRKIFKSI